MSQKLILLVALLLGATFPSGVAAQDLTLQQAIANGQVIARFTGTGGSSGDSVMMELSRGPKAPARPRNVTLPRGSKLESDDSGAQSMMVLEVAGRSTGLGTYQLTRTLQVPTSGSATYVLSAFCAEFEKENPSASTHFSLQPPEPKFACIARRSITDKLSIQATQAAVWIYTDGLSYDHMSQKFPISPSDWSRAQTVAAACDTVKR